MNMLKRQWVPGPVLGLGLLLLSTSYAQESLQLPEPLTADALAELALARNPGVAAMQASLTAAEAAVEPAGALDDPMLSYAIAPDTLNSDLGDRHLVSLSQALPWPGTLQLRSQVAQGDRDAVGENLAALQLRIRAAAKTSFADWFFIHRAMAFNAENQRLLNELVEVAVTAYGAGRGAQQDVVGAQLRAVELVQEALLLERRRQAVAAKIRALLAAPPATVLPAPGSYGSSSVLPDEQQLIEQALKSNPQLKVLRHRLQAMDKRVNLAQKDFYPNFKLNAAYVGTLDPREKRTQLGLSINIPVNRSKRHAVVDQREAQRMQMQFELQDLVANLSSQLSDSHAGWQQAEATVALLEQRILPLATQNLSASRADYSSGSGDFQAVINAQMRLLKTETMLARSQADQWIAQANIERLTGHGLEE